jgi:hypothetical protein
METHAIPSDQWIKFFDNFSRDHVGWVTSIEVLDHRTGPQNIAENLPLAGISFDSKGSRPTAIEISVGDQPERHVNHVVDLPLHIWQAEDPGGRIDIQIEPAQGPVTLLHLHGPVQ